MTKSKNTNTRRSGAFFFPTINVTRPLIALVLLAGIMVQAGSHTWSGATSGLWSVAGNWSAGGAPVNGESPLTLTFPAAATRFNSTNDVTGLQADLITFAGSGYTIYAQAGKTLTLKGTATNIVCKGLNTFDTSVNLILVNTNFVDVTNNQTLTINGPISGSGSFAKAGGGTVNFYGTPANTYAGTTFVYSGNLNLQRGTSLINPAIAVAGPFIIGGPTNWGPAAHVQNTYPEQIADTMPVVIHYQGNLSLQGGPETVGPLTLAAGNITGSGTLRLNGDVTCYATNTTSYFNCPLSLGGVTRVFNTIGSSGYSLNLQGTVVDGGNSAGMVKTGGAGLYLAYSNSYAGTTVITDGTLELGNAWGLGSTAGGTIITNTGVLRFSATFAVGAEPLTLSGNGPVGYAVYDDVYTNAWAGPVILNTNVVVHTLNALCTLTFGGAISGPGAFSKAGNGAVIFAGSSANTYGGGTIVNTGKLLLSKTNSVAVPGPLYIGDGLGGAAVDIVQLLRTNQIADTCAVTVTNSGLLDLASSDETIGSLAGNGYVSMLFTTLTTGGNNASTTFDGIIGGVGFLPFVKNGSGTFTLNGTNTCSGTVPVNGGKLIVNGVLPASVVLNSLSYLGGTGSVGHASTAAGHVAPGNSTGTLRMANLSITNASSSLDVQINGNGYGQASVTGVVNLLNPTLNLTMSVPGAVGNKYMIITNDGSADLVNGAFLNLPEGKIFTNNSAQFQITYKGGDGNDVVLTQLSVFAPLTFGGIQKLGNSQMQLSGLGLPATSYDIQAKTNLAAAGWLTIGTVASDVNGLISFIDTNAPSFPQRFYRLSGP